MESYKDQKSKKTEIAIIGIGCEYPGAHTPLQLWENILARRQQFREMPDVRLPNKEYYDSDPNAKDKTYQNKAAVIDGYSFDWLGKRIPKKTYESTDIVHWLALDTALQALENANINVAEIEKENTGVVLGNTLTGEFTRSNQMMLRWPFVRKTLKTSLEAKGLTSHFDSLAPVMEHYYKSVFTPVNEDTLAGGLANTIAGRICNFLDLHGGGYIVDGACSSSLLAITSAANYLDSHQMDMVIAGGVDVSLDTFELIGFAKTKALTRDEMRVYDKEGKGFLPGEGCGIVVMKRLEDAIRDGDKIYATLQGWGIASDGKGGITAPSATGQARALKRAHQKAQIDTADIDFIEGHGTGTTVGDRIELEGISLALNANRNIAMRNCGVTSFKSIVGHTKAAAGVGAFIKTVIALNQRIIPPTAGLKEFNPIFEEKAKTVYPVLYGEIREPDAKMTAGVSAMGFGGINSHVILQSGEKPYADLKPAVQEKHLLVSNQQAEVISFAAGTVNELKIALEQALIDADKISYAELADYACTCNNKIDHALEYRASVVAKNPADLVAKLHEAIKQVSKLKEQEFASSIQHSVVLGKKKERLIVGALFPGQGSQKLNMGRTLLHRHDELAEEAAAAYKLYADEGSAEVEEAIYRNIERAINQPEILKWRDILKQTRLAQPAITLSSYLWFRYFEKLGVRFSYAAGHSLGELMAFWAAGYYSDETLFRFAATRGNAMAGCGSGTMASLVCDVNTAKELFNDVPGYITLANINAPEQTVVSGDEESIDFIIRKAETKHIAAVKLPVSAAFHSELIKETADVIRRYTELKKATRRSTSLKVVSSFKNEILNDDIDLNDYFAEQCIGQVNFIRTSELLADAADILVELGPGKVLSGLVQATKPGMLSFPVEASANDHLSLNKAIANLFVKGADIHFEELYKNRLIRPFTPAHQKTFLVNPLERPFKELNGKLQVSQNSGKGGWLSSSSLGIDNLDEYLAQRGDFIRDVIASDMRHMGKVYSALPQETMAAQQTESPAPLVSQLKSQSSLRDTLYQKIEEATGFPADKFSGSMKLLDDFNLDSIKAGTLIGELAKKYDLLDKFNTGQFANASLDAIVEAFEEHIPVEEISESTDENLNIEHAVFTLISETTGFPLDDIKPDFKLLDDLNLDSIKAASLIAELANQYNLQGKLEAAQLANASISELVQGIERHAEPVKKTTKKSANVAAELFTMLEEKTGFPVEELKLEFRLLDDLNLDSIKAGEFLAACMKKYALTGQLEPVKYANASIGEIVSFIEESLQKSQPTKEIVQEPAESGWVNAFTAETKKSELNIAKEEVDAYWNQRQLYILKTEVNNKQALNFSSLCKKAGLNCSYLSAEDRITDSSANSVVVVPLAISGLSLSDIEKHTELLSIAAKVSNVVNADLLFLEETQNDQNTSVISAFAASLHLERPKQKIRSLCIAPEFNPGQLIGVLRSEMASAEPFVSTEYTENSERFSQVYKLATPKTGKWTLQLSADDVVVITGGAKGITAELGLAFAEKYKCKVALIGSSAQEGDKAILETLHRYTNKSLTAKYFAADISQPSLLNKVLAEIQSSLGTITGIIHGAGRNIPRRAEQADKLEALAEIAPKVFGAINLIASEYTSQIKFFTALTSIIGVTGMQGNSWYAFSNQVTDSMLRSLKTKRGVKTLSVAYSVWSEVGMGARMGSVDTLSKMGIGAIEPQKGIEHFLKWFEHEAEDQQVVVASRLGGLDTWIRERPERPAASRYLEKLVYFEPGVELVARCKLNRLTDLYADHHNYKGSLLFPTVFGVEAMAQAVNMLSGNKLEGNVVMENISLQKPIVVPQAGDTEIEIHALITSDSSKEIRMHAGISTEQSKFTEDHFSADFILTVPEAQEQTPSLPNDALLIEPKTDLYTWLLFQGPKFQQIDKVFELSDLRTVFSTLPQQTDTSEICFATEAQKPFVMGSPLVRDTLLQSFQLIITQYVALPVKIDRWTIYQSGMNTEGAKVDCRFEAHQDKVFRGDVSYYSKDNQLLEKIEGYQLAELGHNPDYPLPDEITASLPKLNKFIETQMEAWEERLKTTPLFSITKHPNSFVDLSKDQRHDIELGIFDTIIAKHAIGNISRNDISWTPEGRPEMSKQKKNLSISHKDTWLLMMLADTAIGCDLELVTKRNEEKWLELLGNRHTNALIELKEKEQNLDTAGTYIWTAIESTIKAHGVVPKRIKVAEQNSRSVLLRVWCDEEAISVLGFKYELYPGQWMVISFIIDEKVSEETLERKELHPQKANLDADGKFTTRYLTTFKDCRGFNGKTYFTNFPIWMGKFREEVLGPIRYNLLKDLGSGKFGMVTNTSGIKIYSETEALNQVFGKLSVTDKSDFEESFIDFRYEWFHKTEEGILVPLAESQLSTTWVSILDRGIVKKSAIPAYFMDFLKEYPIHKSKQGPAAEEIDFAQFRMSEEPLYQSLAKPRPEIKLASKTFETGLFNGNSVGNLYYSNYYDWQAHSIERYLSKLIPQIFTQPEAGFGEYICLESKVNHLQEAMPFEEVTVHMYLESLYSGGMRLYFEYYAGEGEAMHKLAYGFNTLAWAKREKAESKPAPAELPAQITHHLINSAGIDLKV